MHWGFSCGSSVEVTTGETGKISGESLGMVAGILVSVIFVENSGGSCVGFPGINSGEIILIALQKSLDEF